MTSSTKHLVCTLCLDAFSKPKILPCFHTYCQECLKQLASRHGGRSFPCPNCRNTITVPAGGVSAFQTNFYIDSEGSDAKRTCKTHAKNDLVSFCSTCDKAICVECMMELHKPHQVQTFVQKAKSSKDQLTADQDYLRETENTLQMRINRAKRNQKTLRDKAEEVKSEIKTRYAQLVYKAEKHRDEELARVDAVAKELDSTEEDAKVTQTLQEKSKSLKDSLAIVQKTLEKGDAFEVVMLAKELRAKKAGLRAMVSEDWPQDVCQVPALQAGDVADSIARTVSTVIGHVTTKQISGIGSSLHVSEVVKCSRPNIFCLGIHGDDDEVCVSFEQDDAPVQRFNKNGMLVDSASSLAGKVVFHSSECAECLYITPQTDKKILCAKFNHPFVVEQDQSGHSVVKKIDIKSKTTFTAEWTKVLTLARAGNLVAFDANMDESKFAVLEESVPDATLRSLKIYHMPNSEPAFSFCFKSFHPSDVCFFKVQGREVCLVADETGNSIRMLKEEEGSMVSFIPQGGLLTQPSALNTDRKERLWVGCRDGRIFRCGQSC